jgi:hypothetical protein
VFVVDIVVGQIYALRRFQLCSQFDAEGQIERGKRDADAKKGESGAAEQTWNRRKMPSGDENFRGGFIAQLGMPRGVVKNYGIKYSNPPSLASSSGVT